MSRTMGDLETFFGQCLDPGGYMNMKSIIWAPSCLKRPRPKMIFPLNKWLWNSRLTAKVKWYTDIFMYTFKIGYRKDIRPVTEQLVGTWQANWMSSTFTVCITLPRTFIGSVLRCCIGIPGKVYITLLMSIHKHETTFKCIFNYVCELAVPYLSSVISPVDVSLLTFPFRNISLHQ